VGLQYWRTSKNLLRRVRLGTCVIAHTGNCVFILVGVLG